MSKKSEKATKDLSLEILLNKYKTDNEKLQSENERLKKFEKKFVGYLIILSSAIILSLCVILFLSEIQYILMAFFAFALICVAIFLIFIYSPRTYHLDIAGSALTKEISNLVQALSTFPLENYAVFLPVDKKVYQFVPFLSVSSPKKLPTPDELREDVFKIPQKGIVLAPMGEGLIEFLDNEASYDQYKNDPSKMEILLQELLIDKLNLVKSLTFVKLDKGQYKLVLSDSIFSEIFQFDKPNIKIFTQIVGPISSFMAVFLAMITNRVILLKSHRFEQGENLSTTIYELGELYH